MAAPIPAAPPVTMAVLPFRPLMQPMLIFERRPGGEMVYTGDLKSPGRKAMAVRVRPRAPVHDDAALSLQLLPLDRRARAPAQAAGGQPDGVPRGERPLSRAGRWTVLRRGLTRRSLGSMLLPAAREHGSQGGLARHAARHPAPLRRDPADYRASVSFPATRVGVGGPGCRPRPPAR